jgi:Protein of unknown function (DUF2793)/Chaperone of endosialidase
MPQETTPRLELPLLASGQAQKHVTCNEALLALDDLVHLSVLDDDRSGPPAAAAEGDRHIVAQGAGGAWAGRGGEVAAWRDGGWTFHAPRRGWLAHVAALDVFRVHDGTEWRDLKVRAADLFGVGAAADAENRLAVAAPATLLTHAGGDHRLKINKAAAGDTASVVMQTGYAGRAEIGLAGDDGLSLKVSADGAAWTESLKLSPAAAPVLRHRLTGGPGSISVPLGCTRFVLDTAGSQQTMAVGGGAAALFLAPDAGEAATFIGRLGFGWTELAAGAQSARARLMVRHQPGGDAVALHEVLSAGATSVAPGQDGAQSLGEAGRRWSSVHAVNGTIQTSDAREKEVQGGLGFAGGFVDRLEPILFRWRHGDAPSGRPHAGFRAQDVRAAMQAAEADFAAWGLDDPADPSSRQWTRPDELMAVLWEALRETRARLGRLEVRVAAGGPVA